MIYILQLEKGKFYVGYTDRKDGERFTEHLKKGKKLTVMDAVRLFKTPNLRSRICNIEKMGVTVKREITTINGKHFNTYYL